MSEYGYPPIERASLDHAYQQLVNIIAARIAAGYYPLKLPGERDIAEEFGVSYVTARHATAILRERGLIATIQGRGTFVRAALRVGNPSRSAASGSCGLDGGLPTGEPPSDAPSDSPPQS